MVSTSPFRSAAGRHAIALLQQVRASPSLIRRERRASSRVTEPQLAADLSAPRRRPYALMHGVFLALAIAAAGALLLMSEAANHRIVQMAGQLRALEGMNQSLSQRVAYLELHETEAPPPAPAEDATPPPAAAPAPAAPATTPAAVPPVHKRVARRPPAPVTPFVAMINPFRFTPVDGGR